jgi:hypothetical protein
MGPQEGLYEGVGEIRESLRWCFLKPVGSLDSPRRGESKDSEKGQKGQKEQHPGFQRGPPP